MKKKPHIIIFNPDQWRGDVLGHMGNAAARTPHLDRLVREDAVSFRNAFCQNPVCTPSRCSFMTGWYPHTRGHRTMYYMLHHEHGEPMLLNILKDAGYHVFWGGKNDVVPGQMPKDRYAETWSDRSRYTLDPNWHGPVYKKARGAHGQDSYYSFFNGRMEKAAGEAYYHDDDWLHVMEAIRLIRSRPDDRPLCIYLPLVYPHPPYGVEDPFFSAIDRGALPRRIPAPGAAAAKPAIIDGLLRNFGMQGWSEERWTELRAVYYGMCMRTDALLGELLKALRETGIYDDTALFFFADHGDFTGDYGLVEKTQNTFEDCLSRVPFVVKPPRGTRVKPRVSDAMVELVDFSETVYAITGIDPPYTRFGRSLLPVLAGEADDVRDAAFCEGGRLRGEKQAMELQSFTNAPAEEHPYWPRLDLQRRDDVMYHGKAAMCRTREFKYVRRLYERDELYDLKADPGETRNVAGEPAYRDALAALRERMLTWYVETCDVVPFDSDRR
ncbi:sulfatase-like hydrolase/transferase [bacterium]|nr:sulfatase-like hydrolase/transferase [bacterium]